MRVLAVRDPRRGAARLRSLPARIREWLADRGVVERATLLVIPAPRLHPFTGQPWAGGLAAGPPRRRGRDRAARPAPPQDAQRGAAARAPRARLRRPGRRVRGSRRLGFCVHHRRRAGRSQRRRLRLPASSPRPTSTRPRCAGSSGRGSPAGRPLGHPGRQAGRCGRPPSALGTSSALRRTTSPAASRPRAGGAGAARAGAARRAPGRLRPPGQRGRSRALDRAAGLPSATYDLLASAAAGPGKERLTLELAPGPLSGGGAGRPPPRRSSARPLARPCGRPRAHLMKRRTPSGVSNTMPSRKFSRELSSTWTTFPTSSSSDPVHRGPAGHGVVVDRAGRLSLIGDMLRAAGRATAGRPCLPRPFFSWWRPRSRSSSPPPRESRRSPQRRGGRVSDPGKFSRSRFQ